MSDLYQRLGVSRGASTDEIRRAYKDYARTHHPDRGGNAEEFKKIQEAHEILTDDERRRMYDLTGSAQDAGAAAGPQGPMPGMTAQGIPFQFMPGMGPFGMPGVSFDMGGIFEGIFGGGAPQRRRRAERGPNKHHDVGLSLSDFYHGREIHLRFNQARRCTTCNGSGGESTESCGACNGSGTRISMRQIGPGMMAQTRGACDVCNGEGQRIMRACRGCNSKKYMEKEKQLDIRIVPGMKDGEQMTFTGECSDAPEYERPGDVVLTLRLTQSLEDSYDWNGDDLTIRKTVTFAESILGFRVKLDTHPSGKAPEFVWRGGPLVHGAVLQIPDYGMPKRGGGYGVLFIQVMVQPPPTVPWSPEDAAKLQSVLGGATASLADAELPTLGLMSAEAMNWPFVS